MFKVTSLFNRTQPIKSSFIDPTCDIMIHDLTEQEFIDFNKFSTAKYSTMVYHPIQRFLLNRSPKIVKDAKKKITSLSKVILDKTKLETFSQAVSEAKSSIIVAASQTHHGQSYKEDLILLIESDPAILLTSSDPRLKELGQTMLGRPTQRNSVEVALGKFLAGDQNTAYHDHYSYAKSKKVIEEIKKDLYTASQSRHPYIKRWIEIIKDEEL